MRVFAIAAVSLMALAGAAHAESRPIAVTGLRSLDVEGQFEVTVAAGPPSAVLEGSAAELAKVGVSATANGLRVWRKCNLFCDRDRFDVKLRVTAPAISDLEFSKGVEATVTGGTARELRVHVSMGGVLDVAGACDTLTAKANMGGVLSAENLHCRAAVLEASMGGVMEVHATERVGAKATMGGTIDIAGSPPHVDSDTSMGGIVDAN